MLRSLAVGIVTGYGRGKTLFVNLRWFILNLRGLCTVNNNNNHLRGICIVSNDNNDNNNNLRGSCVVSNDNSDDDDDNNNNNNNNNIYRTRNLFNRKVRFVSSGRNSLLACVSAQQSYRSQNISITAFQKVHQSFYILFRFLVESKYQIS